MTAERPLTGEPIPLDLLNTAWVADGVRHDLLADASGTRTWLSEHQLDAPADAPARRALRETREALRSLLLDRQSRAARVAVNAVLARGSRRPVLEAGLAAHVEIDASAAWLVPWQCAAALVDLLEAKGDRIRGCANPDCVLWFLDTSRPGSRRWCSMTTCGNRDKALRHGRVRHR